MSAKTLLRTLSKIPSPCDGCPTRGYCGERNLACKEFKAFINTGKFDTPENLYTRLPTHKIYWSLYGEALTEGYVPETEEEADLLALEEADSALEAFDMDQEGDLLMTMAEERTMLEQLVYSNKWA